RQETLMPFSHPGRTKKKVSQVRGGSCFVNGSKGYVREIVSEQNTRYVRWQQYHLSDGTPAGSGVCSKKYLVTNWADREATEEEVARMQRSKAAAHEIELMERLAEKAREIGLEEMERLVDQVHETLSLKNNDVKRLSLIMAVNCVRNTVLEDYHYKI